MRGPDGRVYVAAGKGGVYRFNRSGWVQEGLVTTDADVRAVAVVGTGTAGSHHVFYGTQEADGTGRLVLYSMTALPQPPSQVDSISLPQGVEVIRTSQSVSASNITVLVGLACGGVYRYDIPIAGPFAFGAPTATWATDSVFVRDIVIDETNADAFVAGFGQGFHALDLSGGGLSPYGGAWPLLKTGGPERYFAVGVAYEPSKSLLVVGLGPSIALERKFHGPCDKLTSCDGIEGSPTDTGILVYDVSTVTAPVQRGSLLGEIDGWDVRPFGLSVLSKGSAEIHIQVGGRGSGFAVVTSVQLGADWPLTPGGRHDIDDGIPLHSPDEVLVHQGHLYVTCEGSLATFDTNATPPLEEPVDVQEVQCLTVAGFDPPDPRIYLRGATGARTFGISFFDTTNPAAPVQGTGTLATGGAGFFVESAAGIPDVGDPDPRWLYAAHRTDDDDPDTGGLRIFSVGTAANADDPGVSVIGKYVHDPAPNNVPFYGTAVRPIEGGARQVVYVAYSPKGAVGSAGVVALLVERVSSGTFPLRISNIGQVVGVSATIAAQGGHVTYDAANGRLYAAHGCLGMAAYDVSSPLATPTLIAHRELPPAGSSAVWKIVMGPGKKLYISTLSNGVWVLEDSDNFATSNLGSVPTRDQGVGIVLDPTDSDRVYIAEGVAGVGRIDLGGVV